MSLSIPPDLSNQLYFQSLTSKLLGLNISTDPAAPAPDNIKANKLWNDFLTSQGFANEAAFEAVIYTDSGHTTVDSTAVTKYTALYNTFLANQLLATAQSNLAILQTINTQEERDIVFKTLSLVLHMLSVLQQTVKTSSDALLFYTKMQQQYTEMLKKIPLYTLKNSSPVGTLNTTDVGKSTLGGYGEFTVNDVLKYLLQQKDHDTTGSTSWTVTSHPILSFGGHTTFELKKTGDLLSFSCQGTYSPLLFTQQQYNFFNASINLTTITDPNTIGSSLIKAVQNALPNSITADPNIQTHWQQCAILTPLWGESYKSTNTDTTKAADEDKLRQSQRAELNGKLQLYISNAQANRDLAQSQGKPIENLLNQTREAIQGQLTLINSMIELLKGLLGAVARS